MGIWVGSGVQRYTPDRTKGFANLGTGWWAFTDVGNGIGIAADSRGAKDYFVWSCNGNRAIRMPSADFPDLNKMKMDVRVMNKGWLTVDNFPCYGVGVDSEQNVWGVNSQTATRAIVDKLGNITQPKMGAPMGNNTRLRFT